MLEHKDISKYVPQGMETREYQCRIIASVINDFTKGYKSILIESPTGSGKSLMGLVALKIMQKLNPGVKINWVAMRRKLLSQAENENKKVGVTDIQYVSMFDKNPPKADVLCIDEGHHSAAATMASLIEIIGAKKILSLSVGPDSLILVKYGDDVRYERIDEFCDKFIKVDGAFHKVFGYQVRAFDGTRFVWKPLKSVFRHKLTKKAYRVHTEYGRSIMLTEDHATYRLKTVGMAKIRTQRKPIAELEEVKGNDLRVGDYLLLEDFIEPIGTITELKMTKYVTGNRWVVAGNFNDWVNEHITDTNGFKAPHKIRYMRRHGRFGCYITAEEYKNFHNDTRGIIYQAGHDLFCTTHIPVSALAYIIGFYIGDGWLDKTRVVFSVENNQVGDFLLELDKLRPYFFINPILRQRDGSCEVSMSNKFLADFFRSEINGRAWQKRIPPMAFSFTKDNIYELIRGLDDSDGSLSKRTHFNYYKTTSPKLVMDMVELLKLVNVVAGACKAKPRKGGVIKGRQINGKRPSYTVYYSANSFAGRNSNGLGRKSHFIKEFGGHPVKILKIKPEKSKYVYDLSVDDDNWQTFVANGILVHNTATPFRSDRVRLSFERIISDCGVRFLIEQGYLSQFDSYIIPKYTPKEIAKQLLINPEHWGKSVCFFRTAEECFELESLLLNGGVFGAVMLGSDSMEKRDRMFDDFDNGDIQVLINMQLLTEGFDCLNLRSVFVRDSNKLVTLQMAGRSLRKDPNNKAKIANIIQSSNTYWPYQKCVKIRARKQYLWKDEKWQALEASDRAFRVMRKTRQNIMANPAKLPQYLTDKTQQISTIRVTAKGKIVTANRSNAKEPDVDFFEDERFQNGNS